MLSIWPTQRSMDMCFKTFAPFNTKFGGVESQHKEVRCEPPQEVLALWVGGSHGEI